MGDLHDYLKEAKNCQLIVIDHRLDKIKDKDIINGPSVAEIFRQKLPGLPIISITAIDIVNIDTHAKNVYDEIISGSRIGENTLKIAALVKGYQKIRRRIPKNERQLLKILNSPKADDDMLISIIPDVIKMGKITRESIKKISDWIRKVLMAKPGFLIDKLWAATYCGIKFDSFSKIELKFKEDIYDGVFSNKTDIRWWKSKLISKIFVLNPTYKSIYPWEAARVFQEINKNDFSLCGYCNQEYPEIVGFTDNEAKTPIQLHQHCSIPHPKFEKSLFFEEIRIIKD